MITNIVNGAFAITEALRAAAQDPADQTRCLAALANFYPSIPPPLAPLARAQAATIIATASLCRRAALISLARACAAYQPGSYNDAIALRTAVTTLFDAEILIAADNGDSQSYLALRNLRTAVVNDLTARGAQLPRLITIETAAPMPSLALAYKLYGDATRADELTAEAETSSSMLLPTEFQALSS